MKITGNADKPLQKIRQYRNEVNPKIAVTVDLLTTGIDVPAISNLVFLRRVNSRILYEQMLGRATRRCDGIGKEVFRIFDAVFLYEAISPVSNMKPVAVNPNITFTGLVNELGTVRDETALPEIVEQLLAKLQNKRRHLSDAGKEQIESLARMSIADMVTYIRENEPKRVGEWFRDKAQIAEILDRRDGGRQPLLISRHDDTLRGIEIGYGDGVKPEDYLDGFSTFLRENINKIPALMVVAGQPRNLTRQELKGLKLALDAAGYTEKGLQVAWRETKGEDIAAGIIGFVRQAALGDALIPYGERVDRAIRNILTGRNWTPVQRKWLERIGKQLKAETIVDREALDGGEFKQQAGGFKGINKIFNGELEGILTEINGKIWDEAR
jgi:type I restriction enzyme R subunit